MDTLFNINQVAFILKVHPLTVRRYIKEGKLKAVKIAGNVRVKESDLTALNKDHIPQKKEPQIKSPFVTKKVFQEDDPLLRLKGRGASLHISK